MSMLLRIRLRLCLLFTIIVLSYVRCSHISTEFISPITYQNIYPPTLYYYPLPLVAPLSALAELKGESVSGIITFYQPRPPDGPVFVNGNVTGLTKGLHGFHVHRDGYLREGCNSMGPHFNPYLTQHGSPATPNRHIGDLGNVNAKDDGIADVKIIDDAISLTGPLSVVGRGLVVHEKEDDLGKGNDAESLKTGNAGNRLACGIIGYTTPLE